MEMDSYSEILSNLKTRSGKRDPRSIRLAAVTSAMLDVVVSKNQHQQQQQHQLQQQEHHDSDDMEDGSNIYGTSDTLLATKIYAATVSALERTFSQEPPNNANNNNTALLDAVATQMALLELLQVTIPFVSPATLMATLSVASRVLRALITLAQSVMDAQDDDENMDDNQNNNKHPKKKKKHMAAVMMMETKDELGGMNALLRATIRTSSILFQNMPQQSITNTTATTTKTMQQLCQATLLQFLEDRHPKVRKVAQSSLTELLVQASCPVVLRQQVTKLVVYQLEQAKTLSSTTPSSNKTTEQGHFDMARRLHFLSFLEQNIAHLGNMSMITNKIGGALMEWFMNLLRSDGDDVDDAMSDYVSGSQRDATSRILLLKALLSTLLAMLDDDDDSNESSNDNNDYDGDDDNADDKKPSASAAALNDFAARVLASLLQGKPWLVFSFGLASTEDELIAAARVLYAQVVITSCGRVLQSNPTLGFPLLPLSIQMAVQLSKPTDHVSDEQQAAQTIMPELSKLFRVQLAKTLLATDESDNVPTKHITTSLQAMKQVLQMPFLPTWSVSLKALVVLLQLFPEHDEVPSCVESLLQLYTATSSDDHQDAELAMEQAMASLIEGVGLETFWNWVSWSPPNASSNAGDKLSKTKQQATQPITDGIAVSRAWLLPVMKTAASVTRTHRLHLAFFQSQVLGLARRCDALAVKYPNDKGFHMARVVDLWALLVCFCHHPIDIESALPALSQALVRAIGDTRYPQLVPVIAGGLGALFSGVALRSGLQGDDENNRDANILAQVSSTVLPALFKAVETLSCGPDVVPSKKKRDSDMDIDDDDLDVNDKSKNADNQAVESVANAIAEVAKQAPRAFLQSLFKKLMQRLLEATQAETRETEKICSLLCLARALVASESMDVANISLLYRALKPLIRSDENEPRVQKRAYRVLLEIAQRNKTFVTSSETLGELSKLLVDSIMTCQVSARHMRVKCMTAIVRGLDSSNKAHLDVIANSIGEVLLCLKDANGKSREASYQLLLAMAAAQANLEAFFRLLIAALAAETTHMRSAAVTAMSRLVFEYARNDSSVQALLPGLLQTILVMFDDNSREVTKSTVGFVRVCVAALPPEQLEPMLPELVGGLLKNNKGKDRFRSKIKIILKKLVRLYGYDMLIPLIPPSDTRLLTHMRKLSERAARQKAAAKQIDNAGENQTNFDGMIDSDEEDSDDGRTFTSGATGFSRMTGRGRGEDARSTTKSLSGSRAKSVASSKSMKSQIPAPLLRAETDGEVLDMLSSAVAKNVRFALDHDDADGSDADDGLMEFDDAGRLIVPDDSNLTKANTESEANQDEEFTPSSKKRKTGKQETKSKQSKVVKGPGAAYKSKKAGGDVKKKGQKFEPYAYIPLDGKRYTKKNRRSAVEEMSTVVRSGVKRKHG